MKLRVGNGFDVHPLTDGRKLILGGIEVPFEKGLAGHSDADVVLHALSDALLGAAGLPDIGQQFPPTDPAFKDADSSDLLMKVVNLVRAEGFAVIHNVDLVIMAERPAINPHILKMRDRIARILGISAAQVGIKATTTEKLGFVGREEGIAASAVCLIADER